MQYIELIIASTARAYLAFLVTFGVLLIAETFHGRGGPIAVRRRIHGLAIWAIMLPFGISLAMTLSALVTAVGLPTIGTARWDLGSSILAALAAALGADFIFYWFHRFQHRYLWRFHSVHHSIEDLSAIGSYHHWSEPAWQLFLTALPLALFDIQVVGQAAWLAFILRAWPSFIHSSTKLNCGPLRHVIVDNRFHRIHHSREAHHFDRNFGALTPLWDWLFGTVYWPARGEWPEVGLNGKPEPATLREWLASHRRSPAPTGDRIA